MHNLQNMNLIHINVQVKLQLFKGFTDQVALP